jgi:hypothetical protein
VVHIPLAKPSAAPLTPSAAVTLETKAAKAEMMIEDLIVARYLKRMGSKVNLKKNKLYIHDSTSEMNERL